MNKNMSSEKIFQLIKFFIGWPVSILAIFFITRIVIQNKDIIFRFENINFPLLALAAISFFFYFFFRAYVWHKIIDYKGHVASFKNTAYLWETAEIKRFTPGFIWTLMSKTFAFSRNGLGKKTVAYSLAIEIEAFVVGSLLVSLLGIPLILNHLSMSFLRYEAVIILSLGVIFSSTAFIFANHLCQYLRKFKISFVKKEALEHVLNSLPLFSPMANLYLLAISSASLIFFGLGVYFTTISIAYLTPALIVNFVGFFVLSLLIGYLSFLIPMGLGVREGVIIYGLSIFMPLGIASACAVAARIVLILSELVFFCFTFIWNKTKNKFMENVENFISSHKQAVLVGAAIFTYVLYFTTASFLRYDNFHTGRYDLGNMDQAVWNTINGRIFETTNDTETVSRLAGHADFILILISPLYKIWEDPRMLLFLQALVLGLGAVFIFKIASLVLNSKNAAVIFSIAYLLNPSLQYTNLYDFHAVTLATTFLLGTFYFFIKKRYFLFFLFAVLAGLTKEQVWVVISLFGFYVLFFQMAEIAKKRFSLKSKITFRNLLLGTIISSVSLSIFYYLVWIAIPQARGEEHFALEYYSNFGDSPFSVIKNILLSPGKIIEIMGTGDRLDYLVKIFVPLGFLSILSPMVLIFAFPDLIINLLSSNSNMHQLYYQYTAGITPFIFIAAIFGTKNILKWFPRKETLNILLFFIMLATVCSAYYFGPLPGARYPSVDMFTKQLADRKFIQSFIEKIPREDKVAATNNLGSHLSRRKDIFTIPQGIDKADIVTLLLNDPFAQPSPAAQREIVERLKKDENFKLLISRGDFVVFQRKN